MRGEVGKFSHCSCGRTGKFSHFSSLKLRTLLSNIYYVRGWTRKNIGWKVHHEQIACWMRKISENSVTVLEKFLGNSKMVPEKFLRNSGNVAEKILTNSRKVLNCQTFPDIAKFPKLFRDKYRQINRNIHPAKN